MAGPEHLRVADRAAHLVSDMDNTGVRHSQGSKITIELIRECRGRCARSFGDSVGQFGVCPPVEADAGLKSARLPYAHEKGSLGFLFTEPVPYRLIDRVAAAMACRYAWPRFLRATQGADANSACLAR